MIIIIINDDDDDDHNNNNNNNDINNNNNNFISPAKMNQLVLKRKKHAGTCASLNMI